MSFFNLYNKAQEYRYFKSLKVGNSVFALGEILYDVSEGPKCVITKLNLNGDVVWEKTYHLNDGRTALINPQMVECTNGDILIMGNMLSDAKANYLARISSANGTILWEKVIKDALADFERGMLHLGNENYMLAMFDVELFPRRVVLYKINGNGNVLAKKMIDHPEGYNFKCKGIAKGNSKVGVYGSFSNPNEKGLLLEVDFNLTQIVAKITSDLDTGGDAALQYVIYKNNTFYGFILRPEGAFVTRNNINYTASTINTDLRKFTSNYVSNIKHNDQNIFIERNGQDATFITKIDYDLASVWTKKIILNDIFYTYRTRGILAHATNNEAIILDGSGSSLTVPYGHYPIARLNLDLDSCKTSTPNTEGLGDKYSGYSFSNVPYSLIEYDEDYLDNNSSVINPITSEKAEICPTQPDENTCVKDELICKTYGDLIKILDSCLINPELLPELIDYKKLVKCTRSFLDLIKDFTGDFPQYNLNTLFHDQLEYINHFAGNVYDYDYEVVWNYLQQIAIYISGLGNCNCENTIKIDENTWLQSPNFYLQAAGSTGDDSAQGIHLRWTFSGILGEKHLPKGIYAQSQVNFNKPNDFVKIHRVVYSPVKFRMDFAVPPQSVNDGQHYWLYKYDDDTRIFFVYFRNATKYNQVRAIIDPLAHPLVFIKEYGNEIIEIENKRELFFAAELYLTTYGEQTMRLEALSVRENAVFTPKYLSYRKSFGIGTLDSHKVKLFCENGRSIRLKANMCYANEILFEFYSDFITKRANNGEWHFIDNYALTKVDQVAETRLEPLPDVNPVDGKWLRFNDQSYVRCSNYMDKWNGPVNGPFDMNIKDIVSHYITLSEEADNPAGVEFVDLNLTYEPDAPDPDDPENPMPEEELTEINNLNLLRIMSTDYHIARMLGLGMLDIESEIFGTEYVYLASYTTYGDLGNGPQTVKHLSMSLPTSTSIERLPLPLNIHELVHGFVGVSDNADDDYVNTHDGYSFDGKNRFISVVTENLLEQNPNPPFYETSNDIDFSTFTIPVYGGVESRRVLPGQTDPQVWDKPEPSNDPEYLNIDSVEQSYETVPILIPDPNDALFVDIQTQTATYFYATYGINWFSRASGINNELSVDTQLKPYNSLLAPSNVLPILIRKEFPLMFTSAIEQTRFDLISAEDKTFIRLQFDYNADHELIAYQLPESSLPDEYFVDDPYSIYPNNDEVLGDYIEIYFRNSLPKNIIGKALPDPTDDSLFLSRISTSSYFQASTGETFQSQLPAGTTVNNFIGGYFLMGDQKFIIHNIENGMYGLDFIVYKQQLSEGLVDEEIPDLDASALIAPVVDADGYFVVVENMQNIAAWGGPPVNPHVFTVTVGDNWLVKRELLQSISDTGAVEKYIEKTRGVWDDAVIYRVPEEFTFYPPEGEPYTMNCHRGLYKITFNSPMANHPQVEGSGNFVEWFNGTVRLFTDSNMIDGVRYDSRKSFTVFRTENIGSATDNLVLYINDPDFSFNEDGTPSDDNDYILDSDNSTPVKVHYYPSYRVYLYTDLVHNLTEEQILPAEGEGARYSIFALRTVDDQYTDNNGVYYKSKYSVPAPMMAAEIIEARPPKPPKGAKYATRPDFYGKSTYTFTTGYTHKPHGIFYFRADNLGFLSAIYSGAKISEIKNGLKAMGGNDELYFTNRWEDFLDFTTSREYYTLFPPDVPEEEAYRFPIPDKISFFEDINKFIAFHNERFDDDVDLIDLTHLSTLKLNDIIIQSPLIKLIDFIKEAVMNAFVPLTEVPVIYKYIKNNTYKPVNKKQKIRDRNGYLIKPPVNVDMEVTEFDMAPMMKNVSLPGENTVQFTDFTIDGTSDNIYFYAAKELSTEMKLGEFSAVLGPIKLVNSSPPEAPKVKSTIPVLENRALGINPKIDFEIAAYPAVQNIKKINLYRTFSRLDANSVQSMELVKIIDIDVAGLADQAIWTIEDDFSTLPEVPYGDAIYYRLTISRKIEYAEAIYDENDDPVVVIDYAPSQASKIIATTIVENYLPQSPVVGYYSEPLELPDPELPFITLHWNETAYKANYRLYKMNSNGNWTEIARVIADRSNKGQYHYFNTNHPTATEEWTEEAVINSINGDVYIHLEMTNVNSPNLIVLSEDDTKLYHHFKVVAENTSGMLSKEENILTIYNEVTWTDIGGIAVPDRSKGMIIGATFRVRNNN